MTTDPNPINTNSKTCKNCGTKTCVYLNGTFKHPCIDEGQTDAWTPKSVEKVCPVCKSKNCHFNTEECPGPNAPVPEPVGVCLCGKCRLEATCGHEHTPTPRDIMAVLEDAKRVADFITSNFPGYEDCIRWSDDNMSLVDYSWGKAALRLQEYFKHAAVLERAKGIK